MPIILFLSVGLDSAIKIVSVVNVSGLILSLKLYLAFCKSQIKLKAPLLLLPSLKGWFFIIKYNKWAAFSSTVG